MSRDHYWPFEVTVAAITYIVIIFVIISFDRWVW